MHKSSLIALSLALVALSSCKNEKREVQPQLSGEVGPIVANPHIDTEDKIKVVATQLDAITVKNVQGSLGGKTPATFANTDFFMNVDFFYWKGSEDDLEYAMQVDQNSTGLVVEGDELSPDFRWSPGCRVGIGGHFGAYDQWEFFTNWTYYHTKARHSETTTLPNEFLYIPWMPGVLGGTADHASATWTLNFNTLDFELARRYFISKALTLRPHLGIRGVWIDQDYRAHYHSQFNYTTSGGASSGTLSANTSFNAENNFQGAGLRTGTGLNWYLNRHWSIVGAFSVSMIFGGFDVDQEARGAKEMVTGGSVSLQPYKFRINEDFHRVRTNLEGSLGLMWDKFYAGGQHLTLAAVYEIAEWFQQNELVQSNMVPDQGLLSPASSGITSNNTWITTNDKHGNLGMHGVTLKFGIDF